MTNVQLEEVISDSFTQYAGAVIQSRALVDARDFVKPSARQIYYCLYTDKFTHDKPFKKTLKAIGSAMRMYIHGDASCEGIIMRSGQPFSMRYPLIEIEGSYGNLTESENWAAPRYTASRLSELAEYLLEDTNIHTIEEWADNYDDTEQYPRVLASKGFYNIVNGSSGIAVGTAASIPQFNLKEVNQALINLLENPNIDFQEIYCAPDFATGGTIINANEVKKSLEYGKGKACIIQAKIEQEKDALVVTELPFGVYANTICKEIQKLADEEKLPQSITRFNDLTGEQACIKIYLKKNSDIKEIIDFLYSNTSLQKSYSINMTMLENGRFPKVFGWKELLQEHLNHEEKVYINSYQYELEQLRHKLKITEGIIKAIKNIDKVVDLIRKSKSTQEANQVLQELLFIDEKQAKAILDIKLSRLAQLEEQKYLEERKILTEKIERIEKILGSKELLKQEMIKRFKEVAEKFGDSRRTQVTQKEIQKKVKNGSGTKQSEPVEDVVVTYNPIGYLQRIPISSYRKSNFKGFKCTTEDLVLLFSNKGRFFRISPKDIKSCGIKDKGTAIGAILKLESGEKILNVFSDIINQDRPYLLFALKDGSVKKIEKMEYLGKTRNLSGMVATKVKDSEVVSIQETNGNDIILGSKNGYYIRFAADDVRATGRNSAGVKGIKLSEGDSLTTCIICDKIDKEVKIEDKKISIAAQGRGGKGKKYD